MHVEDVARARPLVQGVDVLGAKEKAVSDFLLELRQREVRRVRVDGARVLSPLRVEAPDEPRVAPEGERAAVYKQASPADRITPDTPPLLLTNDAADGLTA